MGGGAEKRQADVFVGLTYSVCDTLQQFGRRAANS